MEQKIQFRGVVSWPVFKRAQWTHLGARWLILLMFPAIMTAWAVFNARSLSLGTVVLLFAVASVFIPLMLAFTVRGWRRTYAKSPILHDPLVGWISQDRFFIEGSTGRSEMTWDRFVRIREGKGVILLYQGPNLFNILAREFFESDPDWDSARRLTASAARR